MSKPKHGKKIEKADADKLNRAEMGVALANNDAEVEAQAHMNLVQCPHCASVVRIVQYDSVYAWYTCGVWGGAFYA